MAADRQSEHDYLHSPLSQTPWYPDVVSQSLEVLPIFFDHDGLGWLKPIRASSLRVGLGVEEQPATAVMKALEVYGLTPYSTPIWKQNVSAGPHWPAGKPRPPQPL